MPVSRQRPIYLFVLAALLLALAPLAPADAATYRWVDEHGNVHYSDQRPSGRDAERVGSETRMPAGEQPEEETSGQADDSEDEERERQQERFEEHQAEQQELREEALEQRRQQCQQLEQDLARLQQGGRFRAPGGEDGELEYMSEEQVQERIDNTRQMLEQECSDL